jgi:hypothetical protein
MTLVFFFYTISIKNSHRNYKDVVEENVESFILNKNQKSFHQRREENLIVKRNPIIITFIRKFLALNKIIAVCF